MSGFLRIPPEQMHHSAAQLHEIARELKDRREQAHTAVSDLLAGFGENARSALAAKLEQWEEETASHHQHLTTHAENHTRIANEFVEADHLDAKATGRIVGNQ
ncbi:WXG100 family type VII secretion target [Mycobacteroides abscessus subsp. bolletii]|uniref:WXG100 family type VII secretion target n=1 Tax=Mycobacteroides abscessus TaxID=36809 RepID=UPI00092C05F2|nr:WXG100 family type VII secretion target [Mycobacteroides abscessus]SIJ47832.1 WXG100 family type VII secretion target [Mycobacteroides abscessus subsp. bolletii]SLD47649.1 WXG100 family type VII secretion target [Mycobacteroides abscessus subsp. bolletii]SLE33135.1 WXG100 family type VII secretion target [Mycobacteroides abscessus subsp. bolletii]